MTVCILGRCSRCVRNKRTVTYCRVAKSHTERKASCCLSCFNANYSLSKCRVELQHLEPNGSKMVLVGICDSEHMISCTSLELPKSCLQLESLHIIPPIDMPTQMNVLRSENVTSVTGFLMEYTDSKWEEWLDRFCQQSSTRFSVHTGKQINAKQQHGMIRVQGDCYNFKIEWSQMYNCIRAGNGRCKPEVDDPLKRRSAPGSRCCECPAAIYCRLLTLSTQQQILEVQLPMRNAHKNHDPLSITDQLCNKPVEDIEKKIEELVRDTRLNLVSLKLVVHDWVTKILIPKQLQDGILNELPNPYNRAYFPTKKDLRNVAHRAIVKRRNSLFDQDSLNKILKEQAKCSGLHYSLQQYSQSGLKTNTSNDCSLKQKGKGLMGQIDEAVGTLEGDSLLESSSPEVSSQPFLLVFQTPQQQKWLIMYGNVVTCMDAIYKTNRYAFPCFFLVVKTSIGVGRVVGTIIPQFETADLISEGIKILKSWNPQWMPQYFMTDKSAAELEAIRIVFPSCIRFVCDFHRSQAFDRWVNKSCHEVPNQSKKTVINCFKKLAYASTDKKFEEVLLDMQSQPWYTGNKLLQDYLREEWLSSKPFWSHVYRQSFHAEIDTDNLTEAFNHTLRSRYLQLRQDTSVTDLCEVLLNIVFPEQQKEYTIAVAQQTEGYRRPRYEIPGYLIDRPRNLQSACLANISKAKQFASSDITTDGNGVFTLKSTDKSYLVDIPGGCCECPYFIKTKIPCKHMFAIFALFCDQWSWYDLPCQLTDSTYMTLETSLLKQNLVDTVTPIVQVQEIFTRNDDGNTEDQQSDAAFELETDTLDGDRGVVLDDCLEFEKRMKIGEKSDSSTTATAQHIPTAQTSAHRLRILQKNAHTILTKCKDVCYLTDDCSVLESVIQSAENIYRELVESADSSNVSNSLPIFPVLSQTSASNSKKRTKLLCRQTKPVKQRVSSKKEVKEPSNPLSKDQSFNGNILPPVSTADTKANTDINAQMDCTEGSDQMDINPRSTSSDIDTGGTCVGMKSALPLQSIGNKPQSMKKDPLEAAKRHPLGLPKLKRPRREKWNFPMRVSEETSEALLSIRKHQLDIKASLMETSTQDKEILTKRDCKENCTGDTYTKQYSGQGNSVNKETKDTNRKGVNSRKCKCSGCSLLDCGLCTFCKDMIKFGGPGKKKQRCSKRKCVMKDDRSTLYSKPTTPSVSNSSPLNFLETSGRTIKQIVPDGNCFFRAVSFHILGDEDKHCSVRAEVLKFEQRNEHMLAKFLMLPANKPSFQEHIRFLQRPDTWATQVEVIAVATMFSVAVFYCRKQDSLYHWEVINPLTCPSVSDVQGDGFPGAAIPHHFELYWDGSHYDCVVLQSTGMCSNSTPVLSGIVSYVDIT